MKASLLSMIVTWALSPSDSDRIVLSSKPPNPAPKTNIRELMAPLPRLTAR